ncbi:MAG TPA: cysteine desulfurase [Firmicutes bacterium]|nr:cysteine desulfurase [Bacillota bacterium]
MLPVDLRGDFPILQQTVHGKPLVYLDNAATTQKPVAVLEAIAGYYRRDNANVHRAIHTLGERATARFEEARHKVAAFIGAPSPAQCIFVKNTTEAINLVAYSYKSWRTGDEIVLTPIEHHSNLVPWQQVARRFGLTLRFMPLLPDGHIDMEGYKKLLNDRTRLVAVTHVSNVLGTINPVRDIVAAAHQVGARVLIDGAQSVPHMPVRVEELDCDYLAFSGHKMCGPTGIGVLYGKMEALEELEPFLFGGEMIADVDLYSARWKELPWRLEAGTPHIAGAIGLGAAIDYLSRIGMAEIVRYEKELVDYARPRLQELEGLEIYGPRGERAGLFSFNLKGIHPHDVATLLDQEGVAVRAGHHCAQPAANWLQVPATVRASFYFYNTFEEIDALVAALGKAREFFGHVS